MYIAVIRDAMVPANCKVHITIIMIYSYTVPYTIDKAATDIMKWKSYSAATDSMAAHEVL